MLVLFDRQLDQHAPHYTPHRATNTSWTHHSFVTKFRIYVDPFQLYKESGVELCIVGADLNKMDAVYFHVKTTPDMPIYLAARASASIPGTVL